MRMLHCSDDIGLTHAASVEYMLAIGQKAHESIHGMETMKTAFRMLLMFGLMAGFAGGFGYTKLTIATVTTAT